MEAKGVMMSKRLYYVVMCVGVSALVCPLSISAQEVLVSKLARVDLRGDTVIKVQADPARGFNYPFYVFIPQAIDKSQENYLYVETNNTGTGSDDLDVHVQGALTVLHTRLQTK